MDFAKIKHDERLIPAPLRLPRSIRERAQQVASDQSTDQIKIKEAEIYRTIIENFFADETTKCSHNQLEIVSDEGGDADSESA